MGKTDEEVGIILIESFRQGPESERYQFKQEASSLTSEKTVQINKHIWLYHNVD